VSLALATVVGDESGCRCSRRVRYPFDSERIADLAAGLFRANTGREQVQQILDNGTGQEETFFSNSDSTSRPAASGDMLITVLDQLGHRQRGGG
jgi:hypothetical protein